MDTAVESVHQSSTERRPKLKEFAELSPTEKCIVVLNFTALFSGILNFLVRLTMTVWVDKNITSIKFDEKAYHSSFVTADDLFELMIINAITVAGVASIHSGCLIWLSVHLLLLLAYSFSLLITLVFFKVTTKMAVLLLLATLYLAVFVRHLRRTLEQRLRSPQGSV